MRAAAASVSCTASLRGGEDEELGKEEGAEADAEGEGKEGRVVEEADVAGVRDAEENVREGRAEASEAVDRPRRRSRAEEESEGSGEEGEERSWR